jgi:hydroxymethylpyrimidine/phosphomethylpyrimidine kinase
VIPNVLSIAGTDPSGGAGIHADIKAISANGAYAMAAVTALVAQTTTGVTSALPVPARFVAEQIDTVCTDVRVDAVKVGLLPSAEVAQAVAAAISRWQLPSVVVDPVLVAKSGDALADDLALEAIRSAILPIADLLTPNLPEAATLLGEEPARTIAQMRAQALRLMELGPARVLLKGGHLPGPRCVDVLTDSNGSIIELAQDRVATKNDHGTGCTLSSAIAALRAQGTDWPSAVQAAKTYLTGALLRAGELDVGHGHGPVQHFWNLWPARDGRGEPPFAARTGDDTVV